MNNTSFSPHYITYKSLEYDPQGNKTIPNCIGKGLYCAVPRYDLEILNGQDIIIEDIRQKCIFNIAKGKYKSNSFQLGNITSKIYFDYMINFHETCIKSTELNFNSQCSDKVLNFIGLSPGFVSECISSSYISDDDTIKLNSILEEEKKTKSFYQIKFMPSILVNNKPVASSWTSLNVMEAICAGYNDRPYSCAEILYDFTHPENKIDEEENSISISIYILMIGIVILLNGLIFLFCRFYLNRKIESKLEQVDMNGTINSVLSNYLKLKNTN